MIRRERQALATLDDHLQFVCPHLRRPRTLAWSDTLMIARDHGGAWVYGPAERDPMRGRHGRTVLPRAASARLRTIAAYGIPFQRIAIAHELDPDVPVGELPGLADGPQPCRDETARRLVGGVPAHPGVTRAIRLLDTVTPGATASADAAQVVRRALDPIIFGVVSPDPPSPGDLGLWYALTAWRW